MKLTPYPARLPRRASTVLRSVLLSLLLASCDLLAPGSERERAELERSWRTWQLNGSESYSYVQQRLCFCVTESLAAVRISVRNGVVTERTRVEDNSPVPTQYASQWGTVDELFQLIDDALTTNASSLLVTYDRQYGYPTHIAIDYYSDAADDELTVTASGLVKIHLPQ